MEIFYDWAVNTVQKKAPYKPNYMYVPDNLPPRSCYIVKIMSVLKQVTNIQSIFHLSLVKLPNSIIWFCKVFAVDSVPCMWLKANINLL